MFWILFPIRLSTKIPKGRFVIHDNIILGYPQRIMMDNHLAFME